MNKKIQIRNRVNELRTALGLSLKELADMVGVSWITIHNWSSNFNQPKVESIPFLLKALNCTFEELFYFNPIADEPEVIQPVTTESAIVDNFGGNQ